MAPPYKRDCERRRRNKPQVPTDTVVVRGVVQIPPANPKWHLVAKIVWQSLPDSGQAQYYEASDWAVAYMLVENLSRELRPQVVGIHPETGKAVRAQIPIRGASLSSYIKGFAALLMSEGDRRRVRMEIERDQSVDLTDVSAMDDYRSALGG